MTVIRLEPVLVLGLSLLAGSVVPAAETRSLDDLLAALDLQAQAYRDAIRQFSCEEEVRYREGNFRRRYDYKYAFTLDDEGQFHNARVLPKKRITAETIDKALVGTDELEAPMLSDSLMWVFVFQKSRLRYYDYEFLGTEKVVLSSGRKSTVHRDAVKLAFRPKDLDQVVEGINEWSGVAWLAPDSLQILKVEAMHRDEIMTERALHKAAKEYAARRGDREPFSRNYMTVSTEFGIVRHGLRLPSLSTVVGLSFQVPKDFTKKGEPKPRLREQQNRRFFTTQTYRDCRFTNVRVETRPD